MGALKITTSDQLSQAAAGIDDEQFRQWGELLEGRTGMVIPKERKSFLVTGLRARMRAEGFADYRAYYDHVRELKPGAPEWALLVDRMTVHETRFFRHQPSLALLRHEVLPAFVTESPERHNFQAWSLGCASGEEAYSLAMLCDDYFSCHAPGVMLGLLATDISQPVLNAARKGIYDRRCLQQIDIAFQQRYTRSLDLRRFRIDEKLQRRICFAQLNVLDLDRFPVADMDLIFCQNMLIYFDRKKRLRIMDNLVQRLSLGGVLIVGPVDIPVWSNPEMERIEFEGTLAFRRWTQAQ